MRWGKAMLAMIRPALIMGPLLGGLGGALLALGGMFYDGSAVAITAMFLFAVFGVVLGLVVATPLCFLSGTILLRLGDGDEQWLGRRRWLVIGAFAGGAFGFIIGALIETVEAAAVLAALFGFLGLLGAFGSHRLLRQRIEKLEQVDADVFS